ncbi:MAG: DegT/DnrJ/EryC1/StrS family aminotransferase [bacterium]|nr:DegT/DnrJ/EryC1/StrS family aminotransferase [bacterium]
MGDIQGTGFIARDSFLPFFRPDLGEAELSAVTEVLRSGWLTYGPKVREFGDACAGYLDVPHAVPVASASAGLLVGRKALGVGPGDEVVLPSLTFVATLGAVVHCGARPVLADIDPANLGLDPAAFAAAITPRTKAVIPVHLAGHPCRIEEILEIARPRGIRVLEDAAHAFGAEVHGKRLGGLSDATVFSFYATKCITSGDGGLITTCDPDVARRVQVLSFHGMDGNAWQRYTDKGRWYYEIVEFGYKMHLGDPAAALGLVQLGRADAFMARRTAIAERFTQELAGTPGLTLPSAADWCTHAWHLYPVRVDRALIDGGRDGVIADLTANRIGSSVHFIPLHYHPVFREAGAEFAPHLGETERYFDEAVSLPLFPSMTEQEIVDVVTVVRESLRRRCR